MQDPSASSLGLVQRRGGADTVTEASDASLHLGGRGILEEEEEREVSHGKDREGKARRERS